MTPPAADPYRYFRVEARELLDALGRGVLDVEKAPADRGVVARVLRSAHTLKGAARIVQQREIGELAHAIEDALAPHREPSSPAVPRATIDALLRLTDRIGAAVVALERGAPASARPGAPAQDEGAAGVRPDRADLETLFEAVLEAGVQAAGLRAQLAKLEHAAQVARVVTEQIQAPRADGVPTRGAMARLRSLAEDLRRTLAGAERGLAAAVDQTAREIAEVRDAADRLRLVAVRALAGPLERVARDAARALDREVAFELEDGGARLDATVLAQLRGALQHVVRNAVAHGIEPAPERARAGKPPRGRVRVTVERHRQRVTFACHDDGRGIDVEAVRAAAVRAELVGAEDAARMPPEEVAALVLRGGLSTAGGVTQVAGRGVGLDVVRDTVARLGGEVRLRSAPGRGTAIEIDVPVSAASVSALHLEASGATVSIPLGAVQETVHLAADRLARTAEGSAIAHRGALVPFVPLAELLGAPTPRRHRSWSAVIVRSAAGPVAVGADRLLGASEVVMHPLPPFLAADPAIAGASVDAAGDPRLVLDPAGIARARGRAPPRDAPAKGRPPILVVDDSLTTRRLVQSILESAGYEVELASSGEEGLARCRARRFGVLLVDIEMPGMDGFEFVRLTRADPALRDVPAILVTSRSSREDRKRGAEVGAAQFITKSEFDQGRLLEFIRELAG